MPPVDKPNYTQIPNAILDNARRVSGAAFMVVLAAYRWETLTDDDAPLSRAQLRAMTGLDDATLSGAIDDALATGWLTRCTADGSVIL